jgi:hypothetical protein
MLKIAMIAAALLASGLSASAQSQWGWGGRSGGPYAGYDAYAAAPGYGGYAAAPMYQPQFRLRPQSGGNGSPVAAGSPRGSTDRASPNSPFASGPYGGGPLLGGGF